ncbi:MAG: hypothetical protein HWD60_10135 [Defluviicoccus sp.]|nr:MAG: hypothetical protein HWD60_10135 [Defluviicoccus sp.]
MPPPSLRSTGLSIYCGPLAEDIELGQVAGVGDIDTFLRRFDRLLARTDLRMRVQQACKFFFKRLRALPGSWLR